MAAGVDIGALSAVVLGNIPQRASTTSSELAGPDAVARLWQSR
jgi:hypothetical protein